MLQSIQFNSASMKTTLSFALTILCFFLISHNGFTQVQVLSTEYITVDGYDKIKSEIRSPGYGGLLQFRFATAPSISWWKAIKIFDKDGNVLVYATGGPNDSKMDMELQDSDHGPEIVYYEPSKFNEDIKVEFWKAKAFGIHTHVGTKYFKKSEIQRKELALTWMTD